MWAIALKELQVYFKSPVAYIILIVTTCVFNSFFYIMIEENREASLRDMFKVMEFLFVFIVPILTMKSFSEEKMTGTIEFLMTTPTTHRQLVLGKYIGSYIFLVIVTLPVIFYYGIIEYFGYPDRGAVFAGYAGILLEGAFFTAIGILASALSSSQVVAAISSYLILFLLYFSIALMEYFSGCWKVIIKYFGSWSHLENFAGGLISASDIIYYLVGIILCLAWTRVSLDTKIWR
jgi:ABC-2 type transport system permease protein